MSRVSIVGIDKIKLLRRLWEDFKPPVAFTMTEAVIPRFDEDNAAYAVQYFITKYSMKALNVDISGDYTNPYWYDMTNGAGAFERVVASLSD